MKNSASTDRAAYVDLRYLAHDHPLRNTLLVDLGAEFKHPSWDEFKTLERGRPLADNTYNTLTGAWSNFYRWRIRAPKESA